MSTSKKNQHNPNKMYFVLTVLCLVIALSRFLFFIATNYSVYTERFQPDKAEKRYNASQYMVSFSKQPIGDDALLEYAGYKYITGTNPILINPDHPPLAKYIIGLFTILTGNSRVVGIVFAFANWVLMMLLVFALTRSPFAASFAGLLVSFDSMVIDQMIRAPMMDIIQAFFFLLTLYAFLYSVRKPNPANHLFFGLVLGLFSATKLYFPSAIFLSVWVLSHLVVRTPLRSLIYALIRIVIAAGVGFSSTYLVYFLHGNSPFSLLGVQKWIFTFWASSLIDKSRLLGSVIPFIFANRLQTWWEPFAVIQYEHWSILWPLISTAGPIASIALLLRLKKQHKWISRNEKPFIFFVVLWPVIFFLYLCIVPISPRYLMLLFFPWYIVVAVTLHSYMTYEKK